MGTNPNVEKAAQIMSNLPLSARMPVFREAAQRMEYGGIIMTPLHEMALKACEIAVQEWNALVPRVTLRGAEVEIASIGRESLASKKPKWKAAPQQDGGWYATNLKGSVLMFSGSDPLTEPQARAVADALNALEAK